MGKKIFTLSMTYSLVIEIKKMLIKFCWASVKAWKDSNFSRTFLLFSTGLKRKFLSKLIYSCDFTDQTFSSLCSSLKTLPSLQNISIIHTHYVSVQPKNLDHLLKMASLKMTDEKISSLAACLRRQSSLKGITLNFWCDWEQTEMTDLRISILSEALKKQTCLENVNIDFSR